MHSNTDANRSGGSQRTLERRQPSGGNVQNPLSRGMSAIAGIDSPIDTSAIDLLPSSTAASTSTHDPSDDTNNIAAAARNRSSNLSIRSRRLDTSQLASRRSIQPLALTLPRIADEEISDEYSSRSDNENAQENKPTSTTLPIPPTNSPSLDVTSEAGPARAPPAPPAGPRKPMVPSRSNGLVSSRSNGLVSSRSNRATAVFKALEAGLARTFSPRTLEIDDDSQSSSNRALIEAKADNNEGAQPSWTWLKRDGHRQTKTQILADLPAFLRGRAKAIIAWPWFERFILLAIVLSCVTLALDAPDVVPGSSLATTITVGYIVFTVIFVSECLLKILACGINIVDPQSYFRSGWNCIDFAVAVESLVSVFIGTGSSFAALRAVRVLRALPAASKISGIRAVIDGLLRAIPLLRSACLVLCYFYFMFGVTAVQLWAGRFHNVCVDTATGVPTDDGEEFCNGVDSCGASATCEPVSEGPAYGYGYVNFDNVIYSAIVLFTSVSREGWVNVMHIAQDVSSEWAWVFFVLLIFIGSFVLVQLTLAVIMASYIESREQQEAEQRRELAKREALIRLKKLHQRRGNVYAANTARQPSAPLPMVAHRLDSVSQAHGTEMVALKKPGLKGGGKSTEISAGQAETKHPAPAAQSNVASNVIGAPKVDAPPPAATGGMLNIRTIYRKPSSSRLASESPQRRSSLGPIETMMLSRYQQVHNAETSHMQTAARIADAIMETGTTQELIEALVRTPNVEVTTPPAEEFSNHQTASNTHNKPSASPAETVVSMSSSRVAKQPLIAPAAPPIAYLRSRYFGALGIEDDMESMATRLAEVFVSEKSPGGAAAAREQSVESQDNAGLCRRLYVRCAQYERGVCDPQYPLVHCWLRFVSIPLAKFITTAFFNYLVGIVVLINAISLAIYNPYLDDDTLRTLEVINTVCVTFFIAELTVKLLALGFVGYFRDGFRAFDAALVAVALIDVVPGITDRMGFSSVRVLRVLRLLRFGTLKQSLPYILSVVKESLVSFRWTALLLTLGVFVYAILGLQLFGRMYDDADDEPPNFTTLHNSLLTVFQLLVGESLDQVTFRHMGLTNASAALYFITWIIVGQYILLNLVLALLLAGFDAADPNMLALDRKDQVQTAVLLIKDALTKLERKRNRQSSVRAKRMFASQYFNTVERRHAAHPPPATARRETVVLLSPPIAVITPAPAAAVEEKQEQEDLHPLARVHALMRSVVDGTQPLLYLPRVGCGGKGCGWIGIRMETVVHTAIILSSVLLAVEGPSTDDNEQLRLALLVFEFVFVVLFLVEMLFKMLSLGLFRGKDAYFRSVYNWVDFAVVLASTADLFIVLADTDVNLRIFRVLRTLRPLRLIGVYRGMRSVVDALYYSALPLANVLVALLTLWAAFAIVGVHLFGGATNDCNDPDFPPNTDLTLCVGTFVNEAGETVDRVVVKPPQSFDNFFKALLHLFICTTGEDWTDLMFRVGGITQVGYSGDPGATWYFSYYHVIFITIAVFFGMSVFTAVLYSNFSTMRRTLDGTHLLTERQREWIECFNILKTAKPMRLTARPQGVWRAYLWLVAHNKVFTALMNIIVIVNMAILGINFWGSPTGVSQAISISNVLFMIIYIAECFIKIAGFGWQQYWRNKWCRFELLLVVVGVVDVVVSFSGGTFPTIIAAFRTLRGLRLVSAFARLRSLVIILVDGIPAFASVGAVALIVAFCYAVVGVSLFGYLDMQQTTAINSHNNFHSVPNAMMLLLRTATGEAWDELMFDCVCAECGGGWWGYVYWISYVTLTNFMLLQMFMMVIVDAYQAGERQRKGAADKYMKTFRVVWRLHDPTGVGFIPVTDVERLLRKLPPPLGLPEDATFAEFIRYADKLQLYSWGGMVGFRDVLLNLYRVNYGLGIPEDVLKRVEAMPEQIRARTAMKIKSKLAKTFMSRGLEVIQLVTAPRSAAPSPRKTRSQTEGSGGTAAAESPTKAMSVRHRFRVSSVNPSLTVMPFGLRNPSMYVNMGRGAANQKYPDTEESHPLLLVLLSQKVQASFRAWKQRALQRANTDAGQGQA